jgi:hypothetical protein
MTRTPPARSPVDGPAHSAGRTLHQPHAAALEFRDGVVAALPCAEIGPDQLKDPGAEGRHGQTFDLTARPGKEQNPGMGITATKVG